MPIAPSMPASSRRASSDGSSSTIGAAARQHGARASAPAVHIGPCGSAGDPFAGTVRERRAAIETHGELAANVRQTRPHAREEAAVQRLGRAFHDAAFDGDARRNELSGAAAVDAWIRIVPCVDDARDTGFDQRLRARPGAPRVAARLERHVSGRAAGGGTGRRQRNDLGVGAAGRRRPTRADDAPAAHEHAADRGVGRRVVKPVRREPQRVGHVLVVDRVGHVAPPRTTSSLRRRRAIATFVRGYRASSAAPAGARSPAGIP